MFASARRAYDSGSKTTASGRELEARALFKAARLLEECRLAWDAADRPQRLDDALRYNLKLWTFFQGELASPQCELPREMRVNLLRISQFVDRRSFTMLATPTPEGLKALIDIDRNIAAGLSAQTEPAPATPVARA
jgi:flagellar protein FlaF